MAARIDARAGGDAVAALEAMRAVVRVVVVARAAVADIGLEKLAKVNAVGVDFVLEDWQISNKGQTYKFRLLPTTAD